MMYLAPEKNESTRARDPPAAHAKKAKGIAFTTRFVEVHCRSALLVALNIIGCTDRDIHRITVVDGQRQVTGVISATDILDFLIGERGDALRKRQKRLELFLTEPIELFADAYIHKLSQDIPIRQLIQYMVEDYVGHIVLVDKNNRFQGLVTERSIIRRMRRYDCGVTLEELGSNPVHTLHADSTILDAVELMARRRIRRIPILSNGEIDNILYPNDIVKHLMRHEFQPAEILT
ncbi:MAG: CBS domain-containing protein, partial [Candidatus Bathyarchaeia archaeon]